MILNLPVVVGEQTIILETAKFYFARYTIFARSGPAYGGRLYTMVLEGPTIIIL